MRDVKVSETRAQAIADLECAGHLPMIGTDGHLLTATSIRKAVTNLRKDIGRLHAPSG